MQFRDGEFYDAVIVPEKCGFFKNKNEKLYLRLCLRDTEGGEHVYPWWQSGKLVEKLREALPHMGVNVQEAGRDFLRNASAYIKPVACRFGVKEEDYNGELRLKINGVYFGNNGGGGGALDDSDIDRLFSALSGADPFGSVDDSSVPF